MNSLFRRKETKQIDLQSALYNSHLTTAETSTNEPIRNSRDERQQQTNTSLYSQYQNKFQLPDFQFIQTLGTGTFGRVYLVKTKRDGRFFAMKLLKKMDVVRMKQVEHILNEKSILSQISHPFIVNLYSSFQDDKNLYMLLEYVVGGELFSYLRKSGRFPVEVARFYTAEIILAIEYLHSLEFIYRDLKPENLLLDREGHVKITDFGFAKKLDHRTWTVCGTPEYLAPEIIQSKGHGKAVDWWALGILLYEMMAGFPPFYDDQPFGIYEKILIGKIGFPEYFDSNSKDLIKKLLVLDRTKRLGNLKGGPEDIKKHKFFKSIDWQDLFQKRITPPIKPSVASEGDTTNFEKYPEINLEEEMKSVGTDPFKNLFINF